MNVREDEAGTEGTPELGPRVFQQIIDLWLEPELARRGRPLAPLPQQALVVMRKEGVQVLLDDECQWIAAVRATRPIAKGETIGRADFSDVEGLRPANVDENAGWIGFVAVGTELYVSFDFRRNRGHGRRLLARAREFLVTAQWALTQSMTAPALEAAYAAAELAVTAELLLFDDTPPRRHPARQAKWFAWTKLGNAPTAHAQALAALARLRPDARYAEGKLDASVESAADLVRRAEEMVLHAEEQVTTPVRKRA